MDFTNTDVHDRRTILRSRTLKFRGPQHPRQEEFKTTHLPADSQERTPGTVIGDYWDRFDPDAKPDLFRLASRLLSVIEVHTITLETATSLLLGVPNGSPKKQRKDAMARVQEGFDLLQEAGMVKSAARRNKIVYSFCAPLDPTDRQLFLRDRILAAKIGNLQDYSKSAASLGIRRGIPYLHHYD